MIVAERRCEKCAQVRWCGHTGARWLCTICWIAAGYILPKHLQPYDRGSDAT